MKIISHRGNLKGVNKDTENNPDQILKCLQLGFDCEIDLWQKDSCFFLGHDYPQYKIDFSFLYNKGLWIHCKNLEALVNCPPSCNYFWHENDDYTLTSKKIIWTFPGKRVEKRCVIVDNDVNWKEKKYKCFGVCTDYV